MMYVRLSDAPHESCLRFSPKCFGQVLGAGKVRLVRNLVKFPEKSVRHVCGSCEMSEMEAEDQSVEPNMYEWKK